MYFFFLKKNSLFHLFFKKSLRGNHFFFFSSLWFFSCFLTFFLSSCFGKGPDARGQTRHQEKWVKAEVGMVTKVWKRGLLLACFFEHDWRSELVDPSQPRRMRRLIFLRLGWAAIVCFLWFSDLCVTQIDSGSSASECFASSLCALSLCWPSFLNTWQNVTAKIGQLEAVKLHLED